MAWRISASIRVGIDVRPPVLPISWNGYSRTSSRWRFVFPLDRQAQADMIAIGVPDLLAAQRPAQRPAVDLQRSANLSFPSLCHQAHLEASRRPHSDLSASLAPLSQRGACALAPRCTRDALMTQKAAPALLLLLLLLVVEPFRHRRRRPASHRPRHFQEILMPHRRLGRLDAPRRWKVRCRRRP